MTVRQTAGARPFVGARTLPLAAHLVRTTRTIWAALEELYMRLQYRRGMMDLLELDDHLLADMGVTRADVRRAANLPLSQSAGQELSYERTKAARPR